MNKYALFLGQLGLGELYGLPDFTLGCDGAGAAISLRAASDLAQATARSAMCLKALCFYVKLTYKSNTNFNIRL